MKRAPIVLFLILAANGASAQGFELPFGADGSLSAQSIQLILLITVLSLAPAILIMITAFPFIITVLSILRQAIGLQQAPPNMLLISLGLFLTYFVMEPVFIVSWTQGIEPFLSGQIDIDSGFSNAIAPFRTFMAARIDPDTFGALIQLRPDVEQGTAIENASLGVMLPSFLLSEVARAFQVGFLIFLPFLVIDLVVSAVLMSMGMMMVPPAIVSLPFKLAFFVVADGWSLIAASLVSGYNLP